MRHSSWRRGKIRGSRGSEGCNSLNLLFWVQRYPLPHGAQEVPMSRHVVKGSWRRQEARPTIDALTMRLRQKRGRPAIARAPQKTKTANSALGAHQVCIKCAQIVKFALGSIFKKMPPARSSLHSRQSWRAIQTGGVADLTRVTS